MIARYTNPEMGRIWSEQRRYETWLQVEIAAAEAMAAAPAINGRWEEDRIAVSPTIDIGVGTALGDKGLVVPVVKDAGARLILSEGGPHLTGSPSALPPGRDLVRGRRVLVVDDDPDIRALAHLALSQDGHTAGKIAVSVSTD